MPTTQNGQILSNNIIHEQYEQYTQTHTHSNTQAVANELFVCVWLSCEVGA